MDINVLKTFVAVCEYAGFSSAGEKLGYSQSTVSSQIRQLENELNTILFDRIRHNVTMTTQGAIVLEYAKSMLELDRRMRNALRPVEDASGEIRLAMADSICSRFFTDDYMAFHKKHPEISLKITAAGTDRMFEMLRKNEADLIFTLDTPIQDPEFQIVAESVEHIHFVAASDHPLAHRQEIPLTELIREPFYLTESHMSYRHLMDIQLAVHSLKIDPVLEIGNPLQICELIRQSRAVAFLPDYITEDYVKRGELSRLPVPECRIQVWNQLLIHKNKWHSPAITAFIHFYKDVIANIESTDPAEVL